MKHHWFPLPNIMPAWLARVFLYVSLILGIVGLFLALKGR